MIWPADDDQIIGLLVLPNEGGFVNNPADPGGPTNYGITQADYAVFKGRAVTVAEIEEMPHTDAVAIYRTRYITSPGFDALTSLRVRASAVDTGVLFGPTRAILFLQAGVGAPLSGILDAKSLASINAWTDVRNLTNSVAASRMKYHAARVIAHPRELTFLMGWVNRACRFIE